MFAQGDDSMTTARTLRQALTQYLTENREGVIQALKTTGTTLTTEQTTSLKNGTLTGFTDTQLTERFNTKVLGLLGLDAFTTTEGRTTLTTETTHGTTATSLTGGRTTTKTTTTTK